MIPPYQTQFDISKSRHPAQEKEEISKASPDLQKRASRVSICRPLNYGWDKLPYVAVSPVTSMPSPCSVLVIVVSSAK